MNSNKPDYMSTIFIAVVTGIIALFIHTAWSTAAAGLDKANEVQVKIVAVEENIHAIREDLTEIKGLLRRSVPLLEVK